MIRAGHLLGFALSLALSATASFAADVSVRLDPGSGFSVRDQSGAVERWRVAEATGNVSRNGALFVHTTGAGSLFMGPGAGNPATTGFDNSAVGSEALAANTTGALNSAFGRRALAANTTGYFNAAAGESALAYNTSGISNSAFGTQALRNNVTGYFNVAVGTRALRNNAGSLNTAVGYRALFANTFGGYNTAIGYRAMFYNSLGYQNTAIGSDALFDNTGRWNSALGHKALYQNSTGEGNTALGRGALLNAESGDGNVAIGMFAGANQTNGSDNIYIDNQGVAGESGRIRIGAVGTHTQAAVAGIHGSTSASGIAVFVTAGGVLGTNTSSARFKQDVRGLDGARDVLMRLRPVTFRYREDAVGSEDAKVLQYGLIAEEVADVAPELVASDLSGAPYSVKYHELPVLLLEQAQTQERSHAALQRTVAAQREVIAELSRRLARIESERK